jgi:hypothetical protein
MSNSMWETHTFSGKNYYLLDLDHPEVEKDILKEMGMGVDVYYDRRWGLTQEFCGFIHEIPEQFMDKDILIAGAGIGAEAVVIGKLARKIYINDLAPVALDYCAKQLEKNNIKNFEKIEGSYGEINIPDVDLIMACFCVYNSPTMKAMKSLIEKATCPVLIVNDPLPAFVRLLKAVKRTKRSLVSEERFPCYLYE